MNSISAYFGVPVLELCLENLSQDATNVPCDEIRTRAAAMTYLDLNGATSLKELTTATHTFPVPVLRQAARELQRRINSEKEFDSAVMAQVMRNYRARRETEGPGNSEEQYLEQAEEQVGENGQDDDAADDATSPPGA